MPSSPDDGRPAADSAALASARETATTIAVDAADLALAYFHGGVDVEQKGHADLVSVADRAVEQRIARALHEAFPDDVVVGEEGAGHGVPLPEGARRWYVDPIDGTTNFLKGLPTWGVSVGLAGPADELLVGVIVMPVLGGVYSAAVGQGATRDGVPLRGSTVDRLDRTLVCHAHSRRSADAWGGQEAQRAGYGRLVASCLGTRMQGCATADMTAVAGGRIDAMWAGGMSRWDVAAGLVIALEAGVRVTDPTGADVTTVTTSFLAGPPPVHAALRALVAGEDPRADGDAP